MLFNSYEFIFLFLPITFFIYFYLNHKRLTEAAKAFLVVASLFFYSYWNPVYLPLILISMVFNYQIANLLINRNKKFIAQTQSIVLSPNNQANLDNQINSKNQANTINSYNQINSNINNQSNLSNQTNNSYPNLNTQNPKQPFATKSILIFGIFANLALLGYFKYMDFFISNINYAFNANFNLLNLTLPLAISFFTFQQVAYICDAYGSSGGGGGGSSIIF